jgi:transcriptional regulator with XRE-family HTH domain
MKTHLACGKFIHKERTKKKLSLAKLSQKAFGSPHQAKNISLIERGMNENVQFNTVEKILSALGYELKDLFLNNN